MIVGFPGETEQDFETLCQFVQAAQFDRLGVFSYSDEDTSKSFELDAQSRRPHDLQPQAPPDEPAAQNFASRAIAQLIGREFPVLIEGPSADSDLVWQARLSTQAPEIDGVCYISDPGENPLRAGEIRTMRITEAHDYDLTGELVDTPAQARPSLVQLAL